MKKLLFVFLLLPVCGFAQTFHAPATDKDTAPVGVNVWRPVQPVKLVTQDGNGNYTDASTSGATASPATTGTPSTYTVTTTAGNARPVNASRKNATITNTGTTLCYLGLGYTAVVGQGIPLQLGQAYQIDNSNPCTAAISAVTASGTTTLAIHEGN